MRFQPGTMPDKYGCTSYSTRSRRKTAKFPGARFYAGIAFGPFYWLWRRARRGQCTDEAWVYGSHWTAGLYEDLGGHIEITGIEHIAALKQPCIFIANHMSTLETFLLPGIIRPFMPVTFVVKRSLTTMPLFGIVMRSRDPVVVDRVNPREDLAAVLDEGTKRLKNGTSVVVFPQHTRSLKFDQRQFNSIGIKLARRSGAPVVPLALKTDTWGQGKRIKELGRVRIDLPAHFRFAPAVSINGNGKQEHAEICRFIGENVARWQAEDGVNI